MAQVEIRLVQIDMHCLLHAYTPSVNKAILARRVQLLVKHFHAVNLAYVGFTCFAGIA